MKKTVVLHAGMGAEIVKHLSQFAELPSHGILAGQAVDSAITDLWGRGGGVYNDLDVFRQCKVEPRKIALASATAHRSELSVYYGHPPEDDYEAFQVVAETVDTYSIESVSRDGMLNYVNCRMSDGYYQSKLSARHVLSGFDLNCVRAGVDLATGKLYWDHHYEAFLHSRQVKIAMMHTPAHTLLRMLKKREELPDVFIDLDLAATACAAVANSQTLGCMLRNKDISLMFGGKHIEQAKRYEAELAPYFTLELQEFSQGDDRSSDWAKGAHPHARRRVALGSLETRGAVPADNQAAIDSMGKGCLFFAYRRLEEERRRKSSQVVVKYDALVAHRKAQARDRSRDRILWHIRQLGTGYVEGQALPVISDKVEDFFSKHSGFSDKMLGLTLAQQWATIQSVQALCRRFSDQFKTGDPAAALGVIELQAHSFELLDEERLWLLLEADYNENSKPFDIEPLTLPAIPSAAGVLVRELLTPRELEAEGRRMSHCVGGYASSVARDRCRILSLFNEVTGERSTAELRAHSRDAQGRRVYDIAQHRGKSNKAPSAHNDNVLRYLVMTMNMSDSARAQLEDGTLQQSLKAKEIAASNMLAQAEKALKRLRTMFDVQEQVRNRALSSLKEAQELQEALQALSGLGVPDKLCETAPVDNPGFDENWIPF